MSGARHGGGFQSGVVMQQLHEGMSHWHRLFLRDPCYSFRRDSGMTVPGDSLDAGELRVVSERALEQF
jgi:hypothetical protein